MNSFFSVAVVLIVAAVHQASASTGCKRSLQSCNVTDEATGLRTMIEYESCTSMCCGSRIYERDIYSQCCGDKDTGLPYNPKTQHCCSWPYGKEYEVHDKTNNTAEFCCGITLFNNTGGGQSCCNGYFNRPEVFSHLTEMCCAGNRQFAGDTAYTECCGDTSFDRRYSSCPCHDGSVTVGIPKADAGCCVSSSGERSGYNTKTQMCCGGVGYNTTGQFCCDNAVGDSATQMCCGGVITDVTADQQGRSLSCCEMADGTTEAYEQATQICCGGVIHSRGSNVNDDLTCCDGVVYNKSLGDACCNGEPYLSQDSVCCSDNVLPGDGCCGGIGFFSGSQACCNDEISGTGLTWPACCTNQTFDAYTQTCCGGSLHNNPINPSAAVEDAVIHTTRCCGNFADDRTLIPYDYMSSLCCNGNIADLGGLSWATASCCGNNVIDPSYLPLL
uniref:Galaxin-like repeats domain-containing protein n=1 Tax=Ciona savignyi TaxID=51511 RepID=H2ZBQ4_CIOSA